MDTLGNTLVPLILLVFLGLCVLVLRRVMRQTREAVERQRAGMERVDESIKIQQKADARAEEAIGIAREQSQNVKAILSELQAIRQVLERLERK